MIPGVGFFYSGLLRRKNALSMIWMSMMTLAVVSFQVSISVSVNLHPMLPPQHNVLAVRSFAMRVVEDICALTTHEPRSGYPPSNSLHGHVIAEFTVQTCTILPVGRGQGPETSYIWSPCELLSTQSPSPWL